MVRTIILKRLLVLIIITTLTLLPFLLDNKIILQRNNDLSEQFWPVFYFIRSTIQNQHQIPLWNNGVFSGLPILPDPQFSLFYPPNFIFFILPTDSAFIAHIYFHTLLASIGMYALARKTLNLSPVVSHFAAFVYILSPKFVGHLEAGHYTLVASSAWLPFVALSIFYLIKKPRIEGSILFSISLAAIFFNHTIIFVLTAVLSFCFYIFMLFISKTKKIKSGGFFLFAFLITGGLIAISLLPQIEWSGLTTRSLLLENPDIYPKWSSKMEFLKALILPSRETEKIITFGISTLFLASFGFLKSRRIYKILFSFFLFVFILVALNNSSPISLLLNKISWFALLRVSTRIWPLLILPTALLAAYGLEKLIKINKTFFLFFAIICISELFFWQYAIFQKPIPQSKYASKRVYEFLAQDSDKFRVYCTTRCLSQHEAVKYELELIDGYNTLQQLNYYKHSWQLMGGYWNYYTLSIPPFGAYLFEKLQPNANSLGEYNTKYVISPYPLFDQNFEFQKNIDNFLVYKNSLYLPRASVPLDIYSPNFIRANTSETKETSVVLHEVWSPGWKAFLNGTEPTPILETPISQRLVNLKSNTKFVDFKYSPSSFEVGRVITSFTIIVILWIISKKLLKFAF